MLMRQHQLFAKATKCQFGLCSVEYEGQIISAEGVQTDPWKIKTIREWSVPTNVKQSKGILGLTGYYRRFVQVYNKISKPLNNLL